MRATIVVLALLLLPGPGRGETPVSGEIATDTTWNLAGSPYVVEGSTSVTSNSVLTIDPGVTVAFDGLYILAAEPGSAIRAVGTAATPVLFTSNATVPSPDDWGWVSVDTSDGSIFSCCVFEYSRRGLVVRRSEITVSKSAFRHSQQYGLLVEDCSPTIEYCNFHLNSTGVYVGQTAAPAEPVLRGCNFYDNTYHCLYLAGFASGPPVTIDAEDNWWGTTVESEIEDEVRHDLDDPTVQAHVDFDPWLGTTPVTSTSWSRLKAGYRE